MASSKKRVDCSELAATLAELAYNFAADDDVTSYDDVVKKMQGLFPQLTREEVSDAIAAYRRSRYAQRSELSKRIERIMREPSIEKNTRQRIEEALKRLETGAEKPPVERRKIENEVIIELRKIESELAGRERDAKRIKELEREIATGEREIKAKKEKAPPTTPEGIRRTELQAEVESLRRKKNRTVQEEKVIGDLEQQLASGKFKVTPEAIQKARTMAEQRIADLRAEIADRKKQGLKSERQQARIKELEQQIASGVFPEPKQPLYTARTEAEQRIKDLEQVAASERRLGREAKRQEEQIARLKEQIASGEFPKPAPKKVGAPSEREAHIQELKAERDLLQKKQELRDSIAELERQLETGEIIEPEKRAETGDEELDLLRARRYVLQGKIRHQLNMLKPKSSVRKYVLAPLRALSAFVVSLDASFFGNQGGTSLMTAVTSPSEMKHLFAVELAKTIKASISEENQAKIEMELRDPEKNPNAIWYERSKLALTDMNGEVTTSEELYLQDFFKKLPTVPGLGKVKAVGEGLNRMYPTYLNLVRARMFDVLSANLFPDNSMDLEGARAISHFVNMWTGRGDLGRLAGSAEDLADVFFAPRYYASRLQLIFGEAYWGRDINKIPDPKVRNKIRKEVAKTTARYFMGVAAMMGIMAMLGADIEKDPRKPDFGKARFGNVRIDLMSGISQWITLASRILNKIGVSTGAVEPNDEAKRSTTDILGRFIRYRSAPTPAFIANLADGKTPDGKPFNLTSYEGVKNMIGKTFTPLTMRDIYEVMTEGDLGLPAKIAVSILGFLGFSVQTYEPKEKKGSQ